MCGATHVDIGQGDVPWVVLGDPEGNELCVVHPNAMFSETGSIGGIVLDAADASALGRFWSEATGWPLVKDEGGYAALRRRSPDGPFLTLGPPVAQKHGKNRIRFDVAAYPGADQTAEVERLSRLGAKPVDAGQGDAGSVVLRDPEQNEFCVLAPQYVRDLVHLLPEGVVRIE